MNPRTVFRPGTAAVLVLLLSLLAPAAASEMLFWHLFSYNRPTVPYIPTRYAVVDGMLQIAGVGKDDIVYDLGCGDGRIVIAAAREHGAKGVGIDINPWRIAEAHDNAKLAGVADRVQFRKDDLFNVDFSEATVVTLYLLPEINRELRPYLWHQLMVGARVVSHDFDMGHEWPPEKTVQIDGKTIYFWTIRDEHKRAGK